MRTLTGAVVAATMVMVACLGFAGVGAAWAVGLSIGGTLSGFNCQTGQLTMVISGATTYAQATNHSAAYLNGVPIALCSLRAYAGSPAAARLVPTHNGYFLEEINVGSASPESLRLVVRSGRAQRWSAERSHRCPARAVVYGSQSIL